MEKIKCPNCKSEIYNTFDAWGRTTVINVL